MAEDKLAPFVAMYKAGDMTPEAFAAIANALTQDSSKKRPFGSVSDSAPSGDGKLGEQQHGSGSAASKRQKRSHSPNSSQSSSSNSSSRRNPSAEQSENGVEMTPAESQPSPTEHKRTTKPKSALKGKKKRSLEDDSSDSSCSGNKKARKDADKSSPPRASDFAQQKPKKSAIKGSKPSSNAKPSSDSKHAPGQQRSLFGVGITAQIKHKNSLVSMTDDGTSEGDGRFICGWKSQDGKISCSKKCGSEQAVIAHRKTHDPKKPIAPALHGGIDKLLASPRLPSVAAAEKSSSSPSSSDTGLLLLLPSADVAPAESSVVQPAAASVVDAAAAAAPVAPSPALLPPSPPASDSSTAPGDGRANNRGTRHRKQYTFAEKSRILDKLAERQAAGVQGPAAEVAKEEGIGESMLSKWKKDQVCRSFSSASDVLAGDDS